MTGIIELTTTTETEAQALTLARMLVASRLAACGQVTGPIQSVYRWQGEICQAAEFRCTLKTSKALTDQVIAMISQNHPYQTPEILVVDVVDCSTEYAKWLADQLQAG